MADKKNQRRTKLQLFINLNFLTFLNATCSNNPKDSKISSAGNSNPKYLFRRHQQSLVPFERSKPDNYPGHPRPPFQGQCLGCVPATPIVPGNDVLICPGNCPIAA